MVWSLLFGYPWSIYCTWKRLIWQIKNMSKPAGCRVNYKIRQIQKSRTHNQDWKWQIQEDQLAKQGSLTMWMYKWIMLLYNCYIINNENIRNPYLLSWYWFKKTQQRALPWWTSFITLNFANWIQSTALWTCPRQLLGLNLSSWSYLWPAGKLT